MYISFAHPKAIFLLGIALAARLSIAAEVATFGGKSSIGSKLGNAAGIFSDAVGIVQWAAGMIPDASDVSGTIVKIAASGQSEPGEDFRGKVKIVWTFDARNNVLGSSDVDPAGMIQAGGEGQLIVHQHMGEQSQGAFVDIIASDDEICISWVLATYPVGPSEPRVWLGDIGAMCGQAWEYSSMTYSTSSNQTHYPACVWMDTDHGDDIDVQPKPITNRQMKINMNAYGGDALLPENANLDYICGATIFTWDIADPIAGPTPRGPMPQSSIDSRSLSTNDDATPQRMYDYKQPRKPRPRNQASADKLVINSRPEQSAITLCNSPTSRGSDFVSVDEDLFCDMDTKTLYPLCSQKVTTGCFDVDAEKLQLRKRGEGRFTRSLTKRYKKIVTVD